MGGYIKKTYNKFVHKDDRCPSNCPSNTAGVCSSYNVTTKDIETGKCSYHRNVGNGPLDFAHYGPGAIIHHDHPNRLRQLLRKELAARRNHVWYKNAGLRDPAPPDVEAGRLIEHPQENIINDCIQSLNNFINGKPDYSYAKDGAVSSHKVAAGNIIAAENLKYLERNVQASW